jgi:hypothetical protein
MSDQLLLDAPYEGGVAPNSHCPGSTRFGRITSGFRKGRTVEYGRYVCRTNGQTSFSE